MKFLVLLASILVWEFGIGIEAQEKTNSSISQVSAASQTSAQSQAQSSQAPPPPLSTPPVTGPLKPASPLVLDGGPFGRLSVNGALTGMGLVQSNPVSGDKSSEAALNNGQIWVQKPDGWFQFYVQAGAYNLLSVGTPFLSTGRQVSDLFGPVPVAFLKFASKNSSFQIGQLPTMMGSEYTFDFENMNIERGLLWTQENAIMRGVQVNQTLGKLTASLSWNDGYYSNRYSWLSGSLAFVSGAHNLTFVGMGNLGHTKFQTLATPVQNNSAMYAVEYTYTKGQWVVQPYWQFSNVPTDSKAGIIRGATTDGGAVLVSRSFHPGWSLAGRGEYLKTTGNPQSGTLNLLYGPGSSSWSATVTPTYQRQRFFARGDVSTVRALSFTKGSAFGRNGADATQTRGVLELGFLF